MGRRGPVPMPSVIKVARGNPGKRRIQPDVPMPPGAPDMPKHLSALARAEWRRIVEQLMLVPGLLAKTDWAVVAAVCECHEEIVKADRALERGGRYLKTKTGFMRKHPALEVKAQFVALQRQHLAELGMTPSARSRVKPQETPANVDPMDEFLNRKRA